ncbi:MAG: hypothetical protein IKU69_03690 [Roseburia sp.]|nr:hypothetical protein [Roseburia sp.]
MAGMQRFITYIYAYENEQKIGNTGYAKVETRGNNGYVEIHFDKNESFCDEMKVHFVYIKDDDVEKILLGTFRLENGRGLGRFSFCAEGVQGTPVSFEKMIGLIVKDSSDREYKSFWKDVKLPEKRERKVVEKEDLQRETEHIKDMEQESLHTMEIPMRNIFPTYTLEDIWRNFERNRKCVQIADEICGVQIELGDLRELPKKYWYLGNNSFLLHGFFNYHYLLLGKLPDGKWFLGIPGVHERQERVMASVFGFPGFIPIAMAETDEEISLEHAMPREKQQGIWYHILED